MVRPTLPAEAGTADSDLIRQVVDLVKWTGNGRRLTQTGAVTLADARILVGRLHTGDEIDPVIGDQVVKTRSSVELVGLTLVVEWAKAARLLRVEKGRLIPVKKATQLLDRPAELWMALFEAFGKLGTAFLPTGWAESFLRPQYASGSEALLAALHNGDGPVELAELTELVWTTVTAPYALDGATERQLATARRLNDRDVRSTLWLLAEMGAATLTDTAAELTAVGRSAMRRRRGEPEPGDPVHEITVTLADVADPAVWRRLLIPAAMPLSTLHQVIQAAMGWQNYHLHTFTDGRRTYGAPDPELPVADERRVRFRDLDIKRTIGYTYDFGDDWDHQIVVHAVGAAEPGQRYPRCVGGAGACPPEDCGGAPGYINLKEILENPSDEEHASMVRWLGLEHASEFDRAAFDIDLVNRRLAALG